MPGAVSDNPQMLRPRSTNQHDGPQEPANDNGLDVALRLALMQECRGSSCTYGGGCCCSAARQRKCCTKQEFVASVQYCAMAYECFSFIVQRKEQSTNWSTAVDQGLLSCPGEPRHLLQRLRVKPVLSVA